MSYTVEQITSKSVNTKFGPKPTYSVKANGEWFKFGFKKPKFKEGDVCEWEYTEGAYGKDVDFDSVNVVKGGVAPVVPKSAPAPFSGGGKGVFPIPPLDGQRAIVRQNSVTNAVNLLKDIVTIDKKMGAAEMAEKIIAVARMFEAYSCGDLDMAKAKEKVEAKAAAVDTNPFEEA